MGTFCFYESNAEWAKSRMSPYPFGGRPKARTLASRCRDLAVLVTHVVPPNGAFR